MKKTLLGIITIFMLLTGCTGNAKPKENSNFITLDQALKEAAIRIDERLAAGTKIAPLNFNSPHDKFSVYVLDELTANLVDTRKLTVVDRKEVELIRKEFHFQFSGEVGDDSMQELGRMLGAQAIISGSLTDMGGFQRIVIRVLNVQSASIEVQYRANISNDKVVAALLTGGKKEVTNVPPKQTPPSGNNPSAQSSGGGTVVASTPPPTTTITTTTTTTTTTTIPLPTYKIGDKGPAGGIIFYDKGNKSDGWQYLEAAPASTEFKDIQWSVDSGSVEGKPGIGDGKKNTEAIVDYSLQTGKSMPAARLCKRLKYGGYDDWFLPSKVELGLMYLNLKEAEIGGFSGNWYWSSTQSGGDRAWAQRFSDGAQDDSIWYGGRNGDKNNKYSVRACRQF